MKDVVEQVLKEEERARLALEAARAQAERLVAEAKAQGDQLLAGTITGTRQTVDTRIATAQKEFLAEKEKVLASVKEQTGALRAAREKDIPAISRAVFQQITSIEG